MSKKQDISNDEALEMVAVAGPTEAQMIEEVLKNNKIECSLQGNFVAPVWPTVSDLDEVRVFVKPADVSRAEELIEGFFTPVGKNELVEGESELGVDDPDKPGGFTI
jgi:hypothetical protein